MTIIDIIILGKLRSKTKAKLNVTWLFEQQGSESLKEISWENDWKWSCYQQKHFLQFRVNFEKVPTFYCINLKNRPKIIDKCCCVNKPLFYWWYKRLSDRFFQEFPEFSSALVLQQRILFINKLLFKTSSTDVRTSTCKISTMPPNKCTDRLLSHTCTTFASYVFFSCLYFSSSRHKQTTRTEQTREKEKQKLIERSTEL